MPEKATAAKTTNLNPRQKLTGDARAKTGRELARRYNDGENIRQLAASTGRSYGFIHRILGESGVQLRARGGARPGRKYIRKPPSP
jgi:hypothetical protein